MAGFGTVIKNGLMYIILSAPFMYGGAILIVQSLRAVIELGNLSSGDQFDDVLGLARLYLALGFLAVFGGGGLIYLKAVSDTVEEGVLY